MNQLQTGKAPLAAAAGTTSPDVIVARADQTVIFKMQNRRASEWLRKHYNVTAGSVKGDTEMYVHPTRFKRIIEELKTAGFEVSILKS